ncbi:MAG: hypothetical protein QME74_05935 [Candidatus Edwardsbacteria bacterium]|nr:hypothetical protein [Candidatus Edwardsbacteria bacterium]
MKKTTLAFIVLAGLSLLVGIIFKLGALPKNFMNTAPSSYVGLAQVFLLAAIALKCCCGKKGE